MRKTIYINCLLKDNKIVAWRISSNQKNMPHDYYKDFLKFGMSLENCDEIYKVKWMSVEFNDDDDPEFELNNYIFKEIAEKFYKQWEIHPEHWGKAPY